MIQNNFCLLKFYADAIKLLVECDCKKDLKKTTQMFCFI